ncbi:MAG: hypothetical protein IPJ71_11600 [Bdellovibrionales bacterium]|nr:hypothetical protein [Bdellovibrionales bacterium]
MKSFIMFYALMFVNGPAFAGPEVPWDVSGKPSCLLRLTVFDENVYPPFAHGTKLIELLEGSPSHEIVNRDGNVFHVKTTDPAALMVMAANNQPKITGVQTMDGREIPVYGPPIGLLPSDSSVTRVRLLYETMAQLPAGAYKLVDAENGQSVTMFVSTRGDQGGHGPVEFSQLSVEIWPGEVVLPQSEDYYRQHMIGSFSNTTGVVDYWDIRKIGPNIFHLESILPYGIDGGIDTAIKIQFIPNTLAPTPLKRVQVAGRTFDFVSLRPRRHL